MDAQIEIADKVFTLVEARAWQTECEYALTQKHARIVMLSQEADRLDKEAQAAPDGSTERTARDADYAQVMRDVARARGDLPALEAQMIDGERRLLEAQYRELELTTRGKTSLWASHNLAIENLKTALAETQRQIDEQALIRDELDKAVTFNIRRQLQIAQQLESQYQRPNIAQRVRAQLEAEAAAKKE